MAKSRKCGVCGRRVSKKGKFLVDLDVGTVYHKGCYIENIGDLPKNIKTISEKEAFSTRSNPERGEDSYLVEELVPLSGTEENCPCEEEEESEENPYDCMDCENPKIISAKFKNLLAQKEHGDVMILRGNDVVYRWDANLTVWIPEEKYIKDNAGATASPVRTLEAIRKKRSATVSENVKVGYSEGGYELLPYGKFIRERVADPKIFDKRSFRTKTLRSGHRVIIGCLNGQWDDRHHKCKKGTRPQSILHPLSEARERRFEKMWKSPKITEENPTIRELDEGIQDEYEGGGSIRDGKPVTQWKEKAKKPSWWNCSQRTNSVTHGD
jgi:hypothetical protein